MDFGFTEEIADYRREVQAFAKARLAPHYQSDDRRAEFRRDALAELAEVGLLGLRIPMEDGGQGADCVTAGMACEEVGKADFNMGYALNNCALIGDVLATTCEGEQRDRFLPPSPPARRSRRCV
jgi:cyclohexanecarboxyl-CoA dehydrogenase